MSAAARDRRRLAELRALYRLRDATADPEFWGRCNNELMTGMFALLRDDDEAAPDREPYAAELNADPAPVHQTASCLPRDQALTAGDDRPASVAPDPQPDPHPEKALAADPLAGLPDGVHWRAARQVLRDRGHEAHQIDGAIFLDGKRCDDPRLRP